MFIFNVQSKSKSVLKKYEKILDPQNNLEFKFLFATAGPDAEVEEMNNNGNVVSEQRGFDDDGVPVPNKQNTTESGGDESEESGEDEEDEQSLDNDFEVVGNSEDASLTPLLTSSILGALEDDLDNPDVFIPENSTTEGKMMMSDFQESWIDTSFSGMQGIRDMMLDCIKSLQ